MDAVALEALLAAGCAAVAIGARRGARPTVRRDQRPPLRRLVRALPHRHRRAARSILELADDCLARHPGGSFEAYTAAETLRTYLPETIAAYLAVPRGYRRERRGGQPSADDALRGQFETLLAGLARIAEADAVAGVSRLSANGAFLNERFGPAPPPRRPTKMQALRRELRERLADRIAGFIEER